MVVVDVGTGASNGDNGVRLSRATLALIMAIAGPTVAAGIAFYRIGQLEVSEVDKEQRIRAIERAVVRFEQTTEAVEKQTDAIEDLRRQVAALAVEQRRNRETEERGTRRD